MTRRHIADDELIIDESIIDDVGQVDIIELDVSIMDDDIIELSIADDMQSLIMDDESIIEDDELWARLGKAAESRAPAPNNPAMTST